MYICQKFKHLFAHKKVCNIVNINKKNHHSIDIQNLNRDRLKLMSCLKTTENLVLFQVIYLLLITTHFSTTIINIISFQ